MVSEGSKGDEIQMSRIEDEVCEKIKGRAAVGKEKYGVTMEMSLHSVESRNHSISIQQ
jgi:hypothetical protein